MWNKKRRDILDLTHERGKASTEIAARSLRKIKEIAVKVRERNPTLSSHFSSLVLTRWKQKFLLLDGFCELWQVSYKWCHEGMLTSKCQESRGSRNGACHNPRRAYPDRTPRNNVQQRSKAWKSLDNTGWVCMALATMMIHCSFYISLIPLTSLFGDKHVCTSR